MTPRRERRWVIACAVLTIAFLAAAAVMIWVSATIPAGAR